MTGKRQVGKTTNGAHMTPNDKRSPGQVAYEADCAARPTYDGRTPRRTWAELPNWARWTWDSNRTGWLRASPANDKRRRRPL